MGAHQWQGARWHCDAKRPWRDTSCVIALWWRANATADLRASVVMTRLRRNDLSLGKQRGTCWAAAAGASQQSKTGGNGGSGTAVANVTKGICNSIGERITDLL